MIIISTKCFKQCIQKLGWWFYYVKGLANETCKTWFRYQEISLRVKTVTFACATQWFCYKVIIIIITTVLWVVIIPLTTISISISSSVLAVLTVFFEIRNEKVVAITSLIEMMKGCFILYEILLVKITMVEFLPLLSSFSTSTRRNLVEELLKAIASRSTARNMKQLLIAWKCVKIYTPSTKKFTKYWCNNHLRDSVYFISLNKDTKRMS